MESSNAGTEVANAKNESPTPAVMSPVPDLVTNVPTANVAPIANATAATTQCSKASAPKADSSPSSGKITNAPIQSTPVAKPVLASVVKTNPTPPQARATSLPSAASEASVKNRGSREEKSRKKDEKSLDHVLRALNSLNTTEEKLAAMCKKYADIFDEQRKLQLLHKQTEKRCSMLQREKEQLQAEQSKAILTRSRLENLCRELQRQNKAIKDESLLKIREEEEKRKEVSAKFQTTMNEITTLMQQNNDKNMKLREDNIDMTTKLKNICEQYEVRQQQVERISKQMQLEQQLSDAKLGKLKMEMATEREILLREKQQLLLEVQQYQQRCTEFQATEVNLRNQISMYNDKYDEFQKALSRSNDVFGGFKCEMEKMSKKIHKLEKETSTWKQRWERSHNALLEMAADKQKSEQELAVVSRQLATLQNLCRTLQTERSSLLAKLKMFQAAGGHEPLEKSTGNTVEKCSKQCEQTINHTESSVINLIESNPVLSHYTRDLLVSFNEGVATEDSTTTGTTPVTTDSAVTVSADLPIPVSPLPDVVGATTACVSEQKPDVNSLLCERLGAEGSSLVLSEALSIDKDSLQQIIADLKSNLPPVGQEISSGEKNILVAETNVETGVPVAEESGEQANNDVNANKQLGAAKASTPQVVVNGVAHSNGSLPSDSSAEDLKTGLDQPTMNASPQPPKSPTPKSSPTKTNDSGKKTKETAKKKKK